MKDIAKILVAAVLAIVVAGWAAPSEARGRHFRSGHDRHSLRAHKSPGFHGKHRRHQGQHRPRFRHLRHHLKSNYLRGSHCFYARPHHFHYPTHSNIGIYHSDNRTRFLIGVQF